MRRLAGLALAGLVLIAAVPATADTRRVAVRDNFFSPVPRNADPGDVIRFRWVDRDNPHTVKFTKVPRGATKPSSCKVRTSGACERKVAKAGVYRFICTIHVDSDGMRGRIRVE
jgi:plastocyanin